MRLVRGLFTTVATPAALVAIVAGTLDLRARRGRWRPG
jgi:hypothetical protein